MYYAICDRIIEETLMTLFLPICIRLSVTIGKFLFTIELTHTKKSQN